MKNTEKVNNEVSKPKGSEEYIEQMMKKRQKTIKIAGYNSCSNNCFINSINCFCNSYNVF